MEAAFDTVAEVTQDRMAEAIKNMPVPKPTDAFRDCWKSMEMTRMIFRLAEV